MSSTSRATRPLLIALVTALLAGLLVTLSAPPAQAKWVAPKPGVTTNNPLGGKQAKQRINNLLVNSIRSTPRRHKIRIATWNLRSHRIVKALLDAHNRGVSVRVVVHRGNARPENPNRSVNRLQRGLRKGNKQRKAARKSGLRRCVSSCRGKRGIPHTKSFAFSKVANARWVVINGSHNATEVAATHQWNDVYTTRGRKGIYKEFETVFNQMYRDRPVRQGYRVRRFGNVKTQMFPWTGRYTKGDPTMRDLNKVRCRGARNTGGRTQLKVAMTSWHGKRGLRIANRIRQMYDRGCQVKIIYAVMGNRILKVMRNGRRGRIPFRQVAQDWNNDGVYDRYLHTKILTIRGRYGSDRSAWVTINGSMNWSPVPLNSDEAVMRIKSRQVVKRYGQFINRWYKNTPAPQYRTSARTGASARSLAAPEPQNPIQREIPLGHRNAEGVDPYANFVAN